VFENGVLRRVFSPKGEEVTGKWRKLHKEEFHSLYISPNIEGLSNQGGMAGYTARKLEITHT
jgi:hypothetical protein